MSAALDTLDLRFFDALPPGFAPAKPIDATLAELERWWRAGVLLLQRKRDGHRHFLVRGTTRTRIYSRGLKDKSAEWPQLTEALTDVLPAGTILDTEFLAAGTDGSGLQPALNGATDTGEFWVFDILYMAGMPAYARPYAQRWRALQEVDTLLPPRVAVMPSLGVSPMEAAELVRRGNWEGIVGWRLDQASKVGLAGTPPRCNVYRWKPVAEDDFVATGFELGEPDGAFSDVVGAVKLAQFKNGKLVSCGKAGIFPSGMSRRDALTWPYPVVVQVRFQSRTANGHCRFPRLALTGGKPYRTDKALTECVFPSEL